MSYKEEAHIQSKLYGHRTYGRRQGTTSPFHVNQRPPDKPHYPRQTPSPPYIIIHSPVVVRHSPTASKPSTLPNPAGTELAAGSAQLSDTPTGAGSAE